MLAAVVRYDEDGFLVGLIVVFAIVIIAIVIVFIFIVIIVIFFGYWFDYFIDYFIDYFPSIILVVTSASPPKPLPARHTSTHSIVICHSPTMD